MIYGMLEIDGHLYPVTNLIDAAGEDTDDITEAVSCVVELVDGWLATEVTSGEIRPLQ